MGHTVGHSSSSSGSISGSSESMSSNSDRLQSSESQQNLLSYGSILLSNPRIYVYSLLRLVNPLAYIDSWGGGDVNDNSNANRDTQSQEVDTIHPNYLDNFVSILGSGTDTLLAGSSLIIGSTGSLLTSLIPPNSNDNDIATEETSALTSASNTEVFNNFFTGLTADIASFIPEFPNFLPPNARDTDGDDDSDGNSTSSTSSIGRSRRSNSMLLDDNELKKFENCLESLGFKANLLFPSKPGSSQISRKCIIQKQLPPSSIVVCSVDFNKTLKKIVFPITDIWRIAKGSEYHRRRRDCEKSVIVTINNAITNTGNRDSNNSNNSNKRNLNLEFESVSVAESFFRGFVLLCKKYKNEKVEIMETVDLIPSISAKTITPFNSSPEDGNADDTGFGENIYENTDRSLLSRLRRSFTLRSPSPQNSDTQNDEETSKSSSDTPSPSLIARIRKSLTLQQQQAGDIDQVRYLPQLAALVDTPSPSLIARIRKSLTPQSQTDDIKGDVNQVEDSPAPVNALSPWLSSRSYNGASTRQTATNPDDRSISVFHRFKNSLSMKCLIDETSDIYSLQSSPEVAKAPNANTALIINYESFKPQSVEDLLSAYDEKLANAALISNYESFKPQSVEELLATHDEIRRHAPK